MIRQMLDQPRWRTTGCGVDVALEIATAGVAWRKGAGLIDAAEGMAILFGEFDLVASLPAVAAPGGEVLMFRPPYPSARHRFSAFPSGVWLKAGPGLWMAHDGEHLLLAPVDRQVAWSVGRGLRAGG